jgi:type I restriction enzyme R subunit
MKNHKEVSNQLKLDECNHVEKPLLDQLNGLGWEIIDLDSTQHPSNNFLQSFTEEVMFPVLGQQLKSINHWLAEWQKDETA